MNDKDNSILSGSFLPPPQDKICRRINPWYEAVKRILWGIALMSLHIHFSSYDEIINTLLSSAGTILVFTGFYMLKKENRFFFGAWIASISEIIFLSAEIALKSSIYCHSAVCTVTGVLAFASLIIQDIFMFSGLRKVRKAAGLTPGAASAGLLILFHGIIFIMGLINFTPDIITFIILLICYVGIFICIIKIPAELYKSGYAIKGSMLKFSSRTLSTAALILIICSGLSGFMLFHEHPMEWTDFTEEKNQQTEILKTELSQKGFPAEVLDDLTEADIISMKDARTVFCTTADCSFSGSSEKNEILRYTGVAVSLPDKPGHRKFIHHFRFLSEPDFSGTEALRIINNNLNIPDEDGKITGRLLCETENGTMTAPFYFAGKAEAAPVYIKKTDSCEDDIYAAFSFPENSHSNRGYISYSSVKTEDTILTSEIFIYKHRKSPFAYPDESAIENELSGNSDKENHFMKTEAGIQFYENELK